jgi:hypothetical protein
LEHRFQANRFTRGNLLFPAVMVVSDHHVIRRVESLTGCVEESISLLNVCTVTIILRRLFADVVVRPAGNSKHSLRIHGLANSDATRLRDLILDLQTNLITAGVADMEKLRACLRCGESIKREAEVCKYCGEGDISEEPSTATGAAGDFMWT